VEPPAAGRLRKRTEFPVIRLSARPEFHPPPRSPLLRRSRGLTPLGLDPADEPAPRFGQGESITSRITSTSRTIPTPTPTRNPNPNPTPTPTPTRNRPRGPLAPATRHPLSGQT